MKKKLVEVSIPLDVINDASAYDKMPGIGAHPKGIHHWWARLPLPAARAILFASLVDDPSSNPEQFPTEEAQETERERLFEIIRQLCQKKIHTKQEVFKQAHEEILKHCGGDLPTVLDPFAGGGSIPLEGMRLGLPVLASDLNPVAVLINKAQLEILPKFANHPPVNPESKNQQDFREYKLAKGLAEDLRYYGKWVNEEAKKRIGKYYPKAKVGNKEHNVVAWLWARTIKCPNPACGCEMPLVRSFVLSTKKKPNFYSRPIIERSTEGNQVTGYEVLQGVPEIKGTVTRSGVTCVCCGEGIKFPYVRQIGKNGKMKRVMIGMVINIERGKTYVNPNKEHQDINKDITPLWKPEVKFPADNTRDFKTPNYGIIHHWQAFTDRQLLGLSTLYEISIEVQNKILEDGGSKEYAHAIQSFMMLTIDRLVDFNNSLCRWNNSNEKIMNLFGKQAIPMVWDYGEANLLGSTVGAWETCYSYIASCCEVVLTETSSSQMSKQFSADTYSFSEPKYIISTDPPYYDNIGYADLSDFFYVWLRHGLRDQYPELLSTMLVPKTEELIASDVRQGSKEAAKEHFEQGFREAFSHFKKGLDARFPLTIYYAFKQDEDSKDDRKNGHPVISLSTGWETLLSGLVSSGFQITATWPLKASQKWRMVAMGTNALTSYIVLACRPRQEDAASITRREYLQILKRELPSAIGVLQKSNLAPVDMAQATIGPGMAIYSRYPAILEQDGTPMRVRTALSLINQALDEILAEQEGDFDAETRWAIAWFEQHVFGAGDFGEADSLCRAKNTAVNALVQAGIVRSGGGNVQLIAREELDAEWNPQTDDRTPVWEITQYLIKRLQETGETGAARLYQQLGTKAEVARELAYRLFALSEKKGWAQEAQAYNSLVLAWNEIVAESSKIPETTVKQTTLDF